MAFIGPADKAGDYIQVLGMPDGPLYYTVAHVIAWLRVLEQTHPDYHGLEVPRECDLEATLAALRQTIFDQAQVVHDETARFMENTKIGTDVAGVRSVFADGEPWAKDQTWMKTRAQARLQLRRDRPLRRRCTSTKQVSPTACPSL